jgi:hypothetical protein
MKEEGEWEPPWRENSALIIDASGRRRRRFRHCGLKGDYSMRREMMMMHAKHILYISI